MKLYISKAAILHDGKIWVGKNHANIIRDIILHTHGNDHNDQAEQGFITNEGEFVDRKRAAQIAYQAGQTKTDEGFLYSYQIKL